MYSKRTSGPLELVPAFVTHCARGETPICRRPQPGTMRTFPICGLCAEVVVETGWPTSTSTQRVMRRWNPRIENLNEVEKC